MTDDELRALVREAVSRHLGRMPVAPVTAPSQPVSRIGQAPLSPGSGHPSHYQYLAVVNTTGACVIEPSVECDHCGYCKSQGY